LIAASIDSVPELVRKHCFGPGPGASVQIFFAKSAITP
jgi:hypothetical protein